MSALTGNGLVLCTPLDAKTRRTAASRDVTMSLKYGDSGEVPSSDGPKPAATWLYA
jgi:hypothetical protein